MSREVADFGIVFTLVEPDAGIRPGWPLYDTTRLPVPPLRLTLDVDAYTAVHAALTERLAALEAQKDLAAALAFSG